MMNRTAYVHMQCLRKHDLRTQTTYHINFSLGHLMFLDFWLKKKQAKSHKFLSWPLDSILDFWLIHQHQFNGPINLIIIEISKEKHRDEHHVLFFFFFFDYRGCPGQLARTSTNSTDPEVNDHVSLHWPSYEQPQGSNLRPKKEQTP
jgi:hypothetical protein